MSFKEGSGNPPYQEFDISNPALADFLNRFQTSNLSQLKRYSGDYIQAIDAVHEIADALRITSPRVYDLYRYTRSHRVIAFRRVTSSTILIQRDPLLAFSALTYTFKTIPAYRGLRTNVINKVLDETRESLGDHPLGEQIHEPTLRGNPLPIVPLEDSQTPQLKVEVKPKALAKRVNHTTPKTPSPPPKAAESKNPTEERAPVVRPQIWTPERLSMVLATGMGNEDVGVFPPEVRDKLLFIAEAGIIGSGPVTFSRLSRAITTCMRYFDSNAQFTDLDKLYSAAKYVIERRAQNA